MEISGVPTVARGRSASMFSAQALFLVAGILFVTRIAVMVLGA